MLQLNQHHRSTESNWLLLEVNIPARTFTVLNTRHARKCKHYIPYLAEVSVESEVAIVLTTKAKAIQIDLNTGSRQSLRVFVN